MTKSAYAKMNISELSRITRERGLDKPRVRTRSEWADFLDKDDAKRAAQPQPKAAADTRDTPVDDIRAQDDMATPDIDEVKASKRTKGKS